MEAAPGQPVQEVEAPSPGSEPAFPQFNEQTVALPSLDSPPIAAEPIVSSDVGEDSTAQPAEIYEPAAAPEPGKAQPEAKSLPWCTTPIEAESSLGPDSHHPIISLSGIPSAVMVWNVVSTLLRLL